MTNEDLLSLIQRLQSFQLVDLSHTLEEGIPAWPTHARFGHILYESYELGDVARQYALSMGEHTGTHMDAPLHFISDGPAHYGVDDVHLKRLIGRSATVSATDLEPGSLLSAGRIQAWEDEHGPIESGDIVLIRYGWDKRWSTGREGTDFLKEWPGLSKCAAEYLVDKEISLVGCDALAIDVSGSEENPAHHTLLGSEVYIAENLNNLDRLPPFCMFMCFPLKIKGGSGSPVRAVALVPDTGV